jgi:hypothetical protein
MRMNIPCISRLLAVGAVSLLANANVARAQAPVLVTQPELLTTYTGYDAHFEVSATSATPLTFKWYLNGVGALPGSFTNVTGSTNSVLTLSSLSVNNSGGYFAVVANSSGAVTSSVANLVVLSRPTPALRFGQLSTGSDGSTVSIPVTYLSQGQETNVTFSVAFSNVAFQNPRFIPAAPQLLPVPPAGRLFGQAATAELSTRTPDSGAGLFGVGLKLGGGAVYPAGPQLLGQLQWNLAAGQSALTGGLVFTNTPFDTLGSQAAYVSGATNAILLLEQAPPVLVGATTVPKLNRQSGLFLQPLQISNPGGFPLSNAWVTISSLPVDSLTNQVTVYNSRTPLNSPTTISLGQLDPGVTKSFTIEYLVSDHTFWLTNSTLPTLTASFTTPATNTIPPGVPITQLNLIRSYEYPNPGFAGIALNFSTLTNRSYYIVYSAQSDFTQTNLLHLVLPPVPGTGSYVQWIDNGPPKTESIPNQSTARFYRVLEVR